MATVVAGVSFGAGTASAADAVPAAVVGPPSGATVVGTVSPTCGNPTVTTINAAITAATAGDTIYVCPGTYAESVKITKNLTLLGAQHGVTATSGRTDTNEETVITAPSGNDVSYVGATSGTLDGFTLTGNGKATGDNDGIVAVEGSPAGFSWKNNVITATSTGINFHADGTAPTTITGNRITGNNEGGGSQGSSGIFMTNGPANNATISANQFGDQETDVNTTGQGAVGATVLSQDLILSNNTSLGSGNFVALFETNNATISGNTVTSSTGSAMYISGGNANATISGNTVDGGNFNGFNVNADFYTSTPSTVTISGNTINNRSNGIHVFSNAGLTSSSSIKNNFVTNSGTNGVVLDAGSSSGVAVTGNTATGSGTTDCLDSTTGTGTSNTANTWTGNRGVTSSPAGLCLAPVGGAYHALTPQRITDTRTGSGQPNAGQTLPAGGTVTVDMPVASVPVGATSVALSVTAVNAKSSGFLSAYPSGAPANVTSVVNFVPGGPGCTTRDCVVPNLVVTQISPSGQVTIQNGPALGGAVDVVVDLQGYFSTTDAVASGAGHYYTTVSTRVADTRCGKTPPAPGAGNCAAIPAGNKPLTTLAGGQTVDVAVAGQGGLPATGMAAAVVQLTATNTATNGYLTAFPKGAARPTASNVNWVVGQTTSTRAIVPLDATGNLSVFNFGGNADVVVDVVGYFSDATKAATDGALFTPVNPARVSDTRSSGGSPIGSNASRSVQVGNVAGIPAVVNGSPTAASLNFTAVNPTANSFFTVTPNQITPPATTSDLNFAPGEVRANADLASLSAAPGNVSVYNFAGTTDAVVDAFGYFSSAATPAAS